MWENEKEGYGKRNKELHENYDEREGNLKKIG